MIEMVRDVVCPQKNIYKDGNNYQVKWRNENDIKFLEDVYIAERKTFTVKFIDFGDYIWHFMRGVFDGDGCVYISKTHDKSGKDYFYKYVSITTASFDFANGINNFLNSKGIKSKINKDSRDRVVYYVKITRKKDVLKFAELIYIDSDCWKLNRKYNIFYDLQ